MANKVKPTQKQLRTIKITQENPKMPLGQAMIKGGYSEKSSGYPKDNFLDRKGTQTALELLQHEYIKVGITLPYMAERTKGWLHAKKPFSSHTEPDKMVDDYPTQLKAAEFVREDMGLKQKENNVAIANFVNVVGNLNNDES